MNTPTLPTPTIAQSVESFLETVQLARSANTHRTYRNGMNVFAQVLRKHKIIPENTPVQELTEDGIIWLTTFLKNEAATTERLYLTAAKRFYEFLAAEELADVNLSRVKLLIQQRARHPGQRLPQFPRKAIEQILEFVTNITKTPSPDQNSRLRDLRDRAFLITLADTGLRVHEACGLHRGDVDFFEGKAVVIGKGNRQAVVRFSRRSIRALKEYLHARSELDGTMHKPQASLPLFARHDDGAGKKVKPVTTTTGRNIVAQRVKEVLGDEAVGTITPHSFRHYFVTVVLKATGNLKMAQELARHRNIAVTQRYAHLSDDELDRGYSDIFD
jgi:site-specific recombinase XerD